MSSNHDHDLSVFRRGRRDRQESAPTDALAGARSVLARGCYALAPSVSEDREQLLRRAHAGVEFGELVGVLGVGGAQFGKLAGRVFVGPPEELDQEISRGATGLLRVRAGGRHEQCVA